MNRIPQYSLTAYVLNEALQNCNETSICNARFYCTLVYLYVCLLCLLHPCLDVVTASLFYPPTCVYLGVPCLQVLTLVYLIYMHSIDSYLCLLRLPHCMRSHVQLRYLYLHTWAIQVLCMYISENFILTIFL